MVPVGNHLSLRVTTSLSVLCFLMAPSVDRVARTEGKEQWSLVCPWRVGKARSHWAQGRTKGRRGAAFGRRRRVRDHPGRLDDASRRPRHRRSRLREARRFGEDGLRGIEGAGRREVHPRSDPGPGFREALSPKWIKLPTMTETRVVPLASDPIMLTGLSILLGRESRLSVLPAGRHGEADVFVYATGRADHRTLESLRAHADHLTAPIVVIAGKYLGKYTGTSPPVGWSPSCRTKP
jgi:hypothetical protein